MEKHRHKTALLAILHAYAPDAIAQQVCTVMLQEMQDGGMGDDQITLELAMAIKDGLQYGNWPWEIAKMNTSKINTEGFGDFLKPIADDAPTIKDQSDRSVDWSEGRE